MSIRLLALRCILIALIWMVPAVTRADDTVRVFKYDGTLQCGMGTGISLEAMAKELSARGVEVVSQEKRLVPLMVIALCGAPTGWANVFEIAIADLARAIGGAGAFSIWFFDYETIFVTKYDGTLQCKMGQEITLEQMASELKAVGLAPISQKKVNDKLPHLACCGCSTGQMNAFEIHANNYPAASALGFRFGWAGQFPSGPGPSSLSKGVAPEPARAGDDLFPWPW